MRQDKTKQCFIWSLIQSYVHRLFIQGVCVSVGGWECSFSLRVRLGLPAPPPPSSLICHWVWSTTFWHSIGVCALGWYPIIFMLQEYDGIQRWNSNSDLYSKIRSHHWTNHLIKKLNFFQRVFDFYFFDGQWPATMVIFLFRCLMMLDMLFLTSFRVFHCTLWSPRPCFHITPSFQSVGHSTIPYYHFTSTEPL